MHQGPTGDKNINSQKLIFLKNIELASTLFVIINQSLFILIKTIFLSIKLFINSSYFLIFFL